MKNPRVRYKISTREELDSSAKRQTEKGVLPFNYRGWMEFYIRCREDDIAKSRDILRIEEEKIRRAKSCIEVADVLLRDQASQLT